MELQQLENLVDVAHHSGQLEVATVVADILDLADEDAPPGGADVVDPGEVHDDLVVVALEQAVQGVLEFPRRGGVEITAHLEHGNLFGALA
jgi:hypothetical protein